MVLNLLLLMALEGLVMTTSNANLNLSFEILGNHENYNHSHLKQMPSCVDDVNGLVRDCINSRSINTL